MIKVFVLVLALLVVGCASANRPLQLISGAGPIYPAAAKDAGIEGAVTLSYRVSAQGLVIDVRVVDAKPKGVFDQAATTALNSWRFNPQRVDGRAVLSGLRQSTISFKLEKGDEYDNY